VRRTEFVGHLFHLFAKETERTFIDRYMKAFFAVTVAVLVLSLLWLSWDEITIRGDTRLLNTIRIIRVGQTMQHVRETLGKEPTVVKAASLPQWLRDEVPEHQDGEYWCLFMGYPPRNIIIYFDRDGRVGFVTWAPT
jgi:hypothetical protein